MKLFVFCLVAVVLVSESLSEPLLLRRRRLYGCGGSVKGALLGSLLGGGGCNSQQSQTRTYQAAPAPAPAPAAAPTVNVNVQNVYNKQDNNQVTNNNRVGPVNNNVVNNRQNLQQNIRNNAESNVYNNEQVNNKRINNNYAVPQQTCEGECEP